MRKMSVFRYKRDHAVRPPKHFGFAGVSELAVEKRGDAIAHRPVRPSWTSMLGEPRPDDDFLRNRIDILEVGRFSPHDDDTEPR